MKKFLILLPPCRVPATSELEELGVINSLLYDDDDAYNDNDVDDEEELDTDVDDNFSKIF